jgi:hypothetical protein
MINEKKIIVCCSHSVTGGPELCHQLVHKLREFGRDAYICYYPFEKEYKKPVEYSAYNAPKTDLEDSTDVFIILPETATRFVKKFKLSRIAIWWQSVDNYTKHKHESMIKDFFISIFHLVTKRRIALKRLKYHQHFTQSHYAKDYLKNNNIHSVMLSDFLNPVHLINNKIINSEKRENIIVYNPKKGIKNTKKLITACSDFKFIPIQRMNSEQVKELLNKAKIYIDFGHHPGKDRPPREAAMAGCCIITGKKGSAKFQDDIAIEEKFKIDDSDDIPVKQFKELVYDIFENFDSNSKKFDEYRNIIIKEPLAFENQINQIFLSSMEIKTIKIN